MTASHPLGALAPLAALLPWTVARLADKVPLDRAGQPANPHVPAQQRSYDEAAAEVVQRGQGYGLGAVLTRDAGVTVIDIDDALQADGTWSPLAQELCAALPGAVVEVSRSGRGLHIWCRYRNPPEHSCKRTDLHIEAYSQDRYILLGHPGATGVLAEQCDALPAVLAKYFPPRVEAADDLPEDGPVPEWSGPPDTDEGNAELIRIGLASRSADAVFNGGASFADLQTGNADALGRAFPPSNGHRADACGFDRSSADAALFAHLAYLTGKDQGRMARLAQTSALKRDKWERPDYLPRTIRKACMLSSEVLNLRQRTGAPDAPAQAPGGPLVAVSPAVQGNGAAPLLPIPCAVPPFARVPVADIATASDEPQKWWIGTYLPAGHVTLLGGHGGAGKSTLALVKVVCIAMGRDFLGLPTRAGRVLYFSAEDPGALVRRRLARVCRVLGVEPAALADRLQVLDATDGDPTLYARGHGGRAGGVTATYEALRRYVEAESIDVLIVDNASDVFDGDEIDRAAVRAFVRSLAQLVRQRDGAVLLLAHVDKSTSRAGRTASAESYSGSTAWHNSVRSRLFLVETGPGLLELQHQKSNLGPRREPMTLMWPRDGLPTLIDNARGPSAADADMRALLALIAEFTERGEHLSTSEQGRPSLTKALSGERSYPRHLKPAEVFTVLRDAERRGLLAREQFLKDRKPRERFAISAAGREVIAGAPSAPSV